MIDDALNFIVKVDGIDCAVRHFEHQVGGFSHKSKPNYMLKYDKFLLKAVQDDDRGHREQAFYQTIKDTMSPLSQLIPSYLSTCVVELDGSEGIPRKYLKMVDLTESMEKPCVIDVKIGRRTYNHLASAEKRAREIAKYEWQEILGFRVVGMKVWERGSYIVKDKLWGRSLGPESVQSAIDLFVSSSVDARSLCKELKSRLEGIVAVLKEHSDWQMVSSSILMIYDSACEEFDSKSVRVAIIDFSHTFDASIMLKGEVDDNFIFGVQQLSSYFGA